MVDELIFKPRPPALASIGRRLAAYVADAGYAFVAIALLQLSLRSVNPLLASPNLDGFTIHRWVFLTVTVPLVAYFALAFGGPNGATMGMRWMHIRVRGLDSVAVPWSRAFARALVLLIPFELNHIVLFYPRPITSDPHPGFRIGFVVVWAAVGLYLFVAWRSPLRQGPHDLVAHTIVERVPADA